MLVEQTLFGTENKTQVAIERIRYYEPPEGYYLAFSGGKDSVTLRGLADLACVRYDAHYNVTTIDPPELIYFIRQHHADVIWDRPEKPLLTLIAQRGIPTPWSRWCCSEYKECGGSGRLVLTGIRAEESFKRARRKMVEISRDDHSKRFLHPIIDWQEEDVWQFIREQRLPYCSLYDEGWKRIGCLFCPLAPQQTRLKELERYPRFKVAFIRAFQKLYEKRKAEGNNTVDRWKDGEEMFWWWIHSKWRKHFECDQLVMFA